jgi:hypothetical protein
MNREKAIHIQFSEHFVEECIIFHTLQWLNRRSLYDVEDFKCSENSNRKGGREIVQSTENNTRKSE